MISIYIVDDHKVFRDGVEALLKYEKDMQVIGSAGTVQAFMNEIDQIPADLILMDISIGEDDGIKAIEWIKQKKPSIKVLILSMHHEGQYIKESLTAGVNGYVLKDTGTKEMILAIRTIAAGSSFYSQKISKGMVQQLLISTNQKKETKSGKKLTPRESEILKLILQENSNQEIADSLFISIRTVDTHRRNILDKLQLKNTVGLVKYAIKNGIIEL